MKKCKNDKRKKYKKTIQVCTLSAFCLTAAIGGLIMENTYADEILLIPNVTQRESQSDTQSQNANNESYVQIISEDIKRTNSVGKEYFHRVRSYPEVSMPDHPQAADKINAYYQNEILAQDDQDAEEFIQNSVSDAESYDLDFSYEYTQEINCMRADEAVISFSIMNTDYTGGAHGGEGITSENFDSQTGTHLSLTDVMTEDPMSSERLAALVAEGLYEDQEVYSMLYDTAQIPTNAKKLQKRANPENPVDKNGRMKRKKRFGRSIKNRCPGYLQAKAKQLFESTGGMYVEVPILYRASQYDHTSDSYIPKKLSQRMYHLTDGTKVQRDWYSSYLLYCINKTYIQINKLKCRSNFATMYQKEKNMIEEIIRSGKKIMNSGIRTV